MADGDPFDVRAGKPADIAHGQAPKGTVPDREIRTKRWCFTRKTNRRVPSACSTDGAHRAAGHAGVSEETRRGPGNRTQIASEPDHPANAPQPCGVRTILRTVLRA